MRRLYEQTCESAGSDPEGFRTTSYGVLHSPALKLEPFEIVSLDGKA
jgi:hypothetical protein